jgi:formyltetrahydrofolate-dependent phosphoribosylglycinamide formyltransferase
MTRLSVLVSGGGSNLQAIINAINSQQLDAEIVVVVSNRKSAYGLERAKQAGIPTLYFPLKPYKDMGREVYDAELAKQIQPYQPDFIVLAGWMHILSSAFLDCFPRQVINLHPALPGQFAGVQAIQRAYEAYQRGEITHSGCMVHYAIPEIDAGAVIEKAVVPILPYDTLADFEARMHEIEHRTLIEALRKISGSGNQTPL